MIDYNKKDQFNNKEFEEIYYVLEILADRMFSTIDGAYGNRGTYTLSCVNVMSAVNTLKSIDFCCAMGHFSDAFTLTRKYRDDLLQYVYLLEVISHIHGLPVEILNKYDITDEEEFIDMLFEELKILQSGESKSREQKAAEAWIYNELENDIHKKDRGEFFQASKYKDRLVQNNEKVKNLFELYFNSLWKEIDRQLNNFVHGNGIKYIYANYAKNIDTQRIQQKLIETVQDITSLFLGILAMTDATKMQSSDYMDIIEIGGTPEEEALRWVAPCVVEYMNRHYNMIHKDLIRYINDNNSGDMIFSEPFLD